LLHHLRFNPKSEARCFKLSDDDVLFCRLFLLLPDHDFFIVLFLLLVLSFLPLLKLLLFLLKLE